MTRLLPLFLALVACSGDDTDNTGDTDDTADPLADLVDPFTQISGDDPDCEEFETDDGLICRDIEGASTFFVVEAVATPTDEEGVFDLEGTYSYVHFANAAWAETDDWTNSPAGDGDRCEIVWRLTGTMSDEDFVACGACDKGISYDLTLDNSQSNCPADKVNEQETSYEDANWGLIRNEDGTAASWDTTREWTAGGAWNDNGFVLWSGGQCEFYGTGECT